MRKMKRVLSVAVCLTLLMGLLPTTAQAFLPWEHYIDKMTADIENQYYKFGYYHRDGGFTLGMKEYDVVFTIARTPCYNLIRLPQWADGRFSSDREREIPYQKDTAVAVPDSSLTVKMTPSFVYGGRYVKLTYEVKNTGSAPQEFQLGTCADYAGYHMKDSFPIGTNTGRHPIDYSEGNVLTVGDGGGRGWQLNVIAPSCDTTWRGYVSFMDEEWFTDNRNYDCKKDVNGMAWSWKDEVVGPGETWSRYVLIGTGELSTATPTLDKDSGLVAGSIGKLTGTAQPNHDVYVDFLGVEYHGTANSSGAFTISNVAVPADYEPSTVDVPAWAVDPNGFMSKVKVTSVKVSHAPAVVLSPTSTTVVEDTALNESWYAGFIQKSAGTVTHTSLSTATPGSKSVTYTAKLSGFSNATANLAVDVLPLPAQLAQTTVSGSGPFTLSSQIKYTGGLTYTETGFVYGAIQNPTLTMNDGVVKTTSAVKTKGGSLTASVAKASLTEGITYYARAYAKTADGTVIYGLQSVGFGLGIPSYGLFQITNNGDNTFTITRTGGSDGAQTVYYRTVNGSAVGGTHFTHKNSSVTFAAGVTSKTVTVTEKSVTAVYGSKTATGYSNADRAYQVELYRVEGGATVDPNQRAATRTMTKDSSYTIDRQTYVDKSKTQAASNYANNGKTDHFEAWKNQWGDGQPDFRTTSFKTLLYGGSSTTKAYFDETGDYIGYHLVMSVYESYDCWGHINFIASGDHWQTIQFDISGTGSWLNNARFPFTSNQTGIAFKAQENNDPATPLIEGGKTIQLPLSETSLQVRCKASGDGNNGWFGKDLVDHARVIDKTEPQLIGIAPMAGGMYFPGDPVTISLVFDEIVDSQNSTLDSNSYITTSWGKFYYAGGTDTNVLYFTGTMPETTSGTISLSTLNCASSIKDMCPDVGTASAGSGSTTVTVGSAAKPTVSVGTISNTNGTLKSTITATNASKLEYVWAQSSTAPAAGWKMLANTSSSTVTTRQTGGTWYLHARATNSDGRVVYAYKSVTIPTTGSSAVVLPDLTLTVNNANWAKTRAITVTRKPSTATVTVKAPGSTTATTVSGSSYTANANGVYTFTLTSNGETVVKQAVVSKLDRTGPTVTFDELDNVRTFVEPVILTVRAEDGESGLKSGSPLTGTWKKTGSSTTYTATFTKVKDGVYTATSPAGQAGTWTLSVTATDAVGNTGTASSKEYKVDLSGPTIKTTLQSQSKTGYVYNYTVTKGGSDIETIVLPDGTITDAVSGTVTLAEPGTYYVLATDKVGHVAQSAGMTVPENQNIDGVAPSVRLSGTGESDWIKGPAVVEVEVREAGSTPTAKRADTGENIPLTKKVVNGRTFDDLYVGSFSVTENGNYTVTAVDENGNEGEAMIGVDVIDPDAPTIGTPTGNPTEWTAQSATISFTATDEASGVKMVTVKKGDTAVAVTGGDGEWAFTADSNGIYTITVTDAVGNTATERVEVTKIDNAAPTLEVTGGDVGGASLELTVSAGSAGSGVTITVSKDGGAAETLSGETYPVTAAGTYTFTATTGTGLTAVETVKVYTVTFDSSGGGAVDSQLVVSGGRASKPDDPSRGVWYTFTGWKSGESAWDFGTSRVTGDVTLVAQWEDVPHTYDLEVTAPVFEAVRYGYAQPAAKAVTITSTGNTATTVTDVALSGENADRFTLAGTGTSVAPGGKLESYTLRPNAGLGVGTYTATVTVTYHDGETAADTVTFTVNKALPIVTAPVAKTLTYNGEAQALVTAGSAVGGELQYSQDGAAYSADIPAMTNAGDYTVYYKVVGGDNYEDVEPVSVPVTIARKAIAGTVTVSGTAAMAQTLTAEYAPGDPAETVAYQWYRRDVAIEGAAGTAYTIAADDVGSSIQVKVSGTGNYTGTVSSKATAQVTPAQTSVTAWPTAGAITYGQSLSDSALTGGAADIGGTFAWADETIRPAVSDSGKTEYGVIFTPDAAGYSAVTGKVTLTVNKATPAVTVAAVDGLTYTGSAQTLVTGSATGGELQYSLDDGGYTAAVPTGTDAGSYTISYKVVGGDNYEDVAEQSVAVTIARAGNSITGFTCGDIIHGETPQPAAATDFGEIIYTYSRTEDGEYASWSGDGQSGTWYVKASVGETDNYAGAVKIISFKETAQRENTPSADIDYPAETLTGLTPGTQYIITPAGGEEVTMTADEKGEIPIREEWLGKTLFITTKARDESFSNSFPQSLPIPARPNSPSVQGVNETLDGEQDGKITGVSGAMEYSADDGVTWTDCAGTEVTDLAPGSYQVRLKATDSSFAGNAATVTIATGDARTYTLNLTVPAFDTVAEGYVQPEAKAIVITSSGNSDSTVYSVVSDTAAFIVSGGGDTVPAGGSISTWSVQPADALAAGSYAATITVTYDNSATVTAEVTFTVNEATPEIRIDFSHETLTGFEDGCSYMINGEEVTPVDGCLPAGEYIGKTISIIKKGNGTATDSEPQSLTVPPRPAAPTGPGAEAETVKDKGDGKITGMNGKMEYKIGDGQWQDGTDVLGDLPAGTTVTLRLKATDDSFAGEARTLTIGAGRTLTVTFNTQGGNPVASITGLAYASTAASPAAPTRSGYTFGGWYTEAGCVYRWNFESELTGDLTLYAKWMEKTYSISGTVTGDAQPLGNATVKLVQGKTVIQTVTTGADGTYSFDNVAPGDYNVVALKDGKTMTILVTITGADAVGQDLVMPTERVNSVLEVKGADTPDVVVGGLEAEAVANKESSSTVTVTMTVESQEEAQAANAGEIKAQAGTNTELAYLEIKVQKKVETTVSGSTSTSETAITSTQSLMEIIIPFDFTGKGNVKVYRYHEGQVDSITEAANADQERIVLGTDRITLYARNFSTYAIGYTQAKPSKPSGGGNSGGSTSTPTPTIQQPEHGTVTVSPTRPEKDDKVVVTVTPEDGYEVDTVTVTDKNGDPVTVTKNADGTYTFTQPAGKVTISAVMKAAESVCPKDSTCPIWPYTDASTTAWYHDGVHYCIEHDLMNGYGNHKFGPGDPLTRGMLAQILYNQAGRPTVSGNSPFADVAPNTWYAKAITWAAAEGVVKGYGDGRFGPTDPITREQLAAMLWRYAQAKGEDVSVSEDTNILSYQDFDRVSQWAVPAMQWAVGSGVVNGKGNGILDPTGNATRAEAATMLQRFCGKLKK